MELNNVGIVFDEHCRKLVDEGLDFLVEDVIGIVEDETIDVHLQVD